MTTHSGDRLVTDHPRKHDFVTVSSDAGDEWVGVVTGEIRKSGTIYSYVIQPWDHNGPMNTEVTAHESDVTVHESGRITVMDDINHEKFKHR